MNKWLGVFGLVALSLASVAEAAKLNCVEITRSRSQWTVSAEESGGALSVEAWAPLSKKADTVFTQCEKGFDLAKSFDCTKGENSVSMQLYGLDKKARIGYVRLDRGNEKFLNFVILCE